MLSKFRQAASPFVELINLCYLTEGVVYPSMGNYVFTDMDVTRCGGTILVSTAKPSPKMKLLIPEVNEETHTRLIAFRLKSNKVRSLSGVKTDGWWSGVVASDRGMFRAYKIIDKFKALYCVRSQVNSSL